MDIRRFPTHNQLTAAFIGNSLFVAMGINGTLLTSLDGLTWTTSDSHTSQPLNGSAFGAGTLVVVGGATTDIFVSVSNVVLSSPQKKATP